MFEKAFLKELGCLIEELEKESSVEVVVVLSPSSGSYRDLDHQAGFLASLGMLLLAVHSPWEFWPDMLVFWVSISYLLGLIVSAKWSRLRRLLVSKERLKQQVRFAGDAYFHRKRMTSTRSRTGLMVYLSLFERSGKLLPDVGIEACVPTSVFHQAEQKWDSTTSVEQFQSVVLAELKNLIDPLRRALPRPDDDENELPNEICLVSAGAL